jgi:iron complex outermembrane recepter protein
MGRKKGSPMKTNLRQHLLASTLLVGAFAYATPAFAQETQSPDPAAQPPSGPVEAQPTPSVSSQGEEVETGGDIIVTGSRIPQPNLESAAPVTVVSDADVKLTGATRIEDVLNQLPSVGAAQASGISNGASGTAEIDLRYLGSKRTLSLINGRRLMPGSPNSTTQAGDVNVIPAALIRRVEVLTGGASSVYGADAVAGVVNFIMDTDFEGIRFDANYSTYWHKQDNPFVGNCLSVSSSQQFCGETDAAGNPIHAIGDPVHIRDLITNRRGVNAEQFPLPTGSTFDGRALDGTISIGAGFDDGRGHAVAYFGYRDVKPVLQANRDFSACTIQNSAAGTPICGGSATANPGTAIIFTGGGTSTLAALGPGTITPNVGNLFNFAPLNYFQRPDERYIAGAFANYEINSTFKPYLEFMFMDDRTLAQIAPSGDFGNTLTINCDNPLLSTVPGSGGSPGVSVFDVVCNPVNLINNFIGSFPVAVDAPYNPNPAAPAILFPNTIPGGADYNRAFFQLLRRNTEGGPRISDLRHTSFRGVLGMRGDLSNVFSYDTYYQYGRTNYTQVYKNEFSISRLLKALDVVDDPSTPAVDPVCRSVLDNTDPFCVPYDAFGTAPSQASIDYLNVFGVIQGYTSEQVANFNVTGLLGEAGVQTPWAEDGVGINAGLEWRKESLELNPDQSFQAQPSSDLAGQGAPTLPVAGNFRVFEIFAEAQIPIIQKSFIEELSVNLGYRKSWYKTENRLADVGEDPSRKYDTDTYKISAEFAPIRDVRFRAAYNRAVRAPNIQELFAPQFVGLGGSVDPCVLQDAAGNPAPVTANDFGCLAQGLTVGQVVVGNPAGQYNALLGGNADLTPEKATTKTVGVVLQPSFIPRLAVTVDYWNITLKNAIQGFGADAILNACVSDTTATVVSPACALVQRNPAGSLWLTGTGFTIDLPNNEGQMKTSGIDLNVAYSHPVFSMGRLSHSFIGTYLQKFDVDNNLTEPYSCDGYYGPVCSGAVVAGGAPMPKWRHKWRSTWDTPWGLGLSLQWRHIGKVKAETLQASNSVNGANNFDPGLRVKAHNYFDLAATYTLFDRVNLRAGINNLLDNDPPLVTSGRALSPGSNLCPTGPCNGNTYPGTWDALGRYLWVGATIDFVPPKAPPPVAPVVAPPPPPPPAAPATQTCPDGSVILATEACPAPPPPPPPPPPAPERG